MTRKCLRVWPDQADRLRNLTAQDLLNAVRQLPVQETPEFAALRVRLPPSVVTALDDASRQTRRSVQDLLVEAAWVYREQNPPEPDWQEPGPRFDNEEQSLKARTLRLEPEDRELIRNLGRGVKTIPHRRAAFEALAPIIRDLQRRLPNRSKAARKTVNVVVTEELNEALEPHLEAGHSFTSIILRAADATDVDSRRP